MYVQMLCFPLGDTVELSCPQVTQLLPWSPRAWSPAALLCSAIQLPRPGPASSGPPCPLGHPLLHPQVLSFPWALNCIYWPHFPYHLKCHFPASLYFWICSSFVTKLMPVLCFLLRGCIFGPCKWTFSFLPLWEGVWGACGATASPACWWVLGVCKHVGVTSSPQFRTPTVSSGKWWLFTLVRSYN